jgi:hypothetical protein
LLGKSEDLFRVSEYLFVFGEHCLGSALLGMLDPEEKDAAGVPLPARALVVLEGTTVKLTILYPATTGRNFEEVFRVTWWLSPPHSSPKIEKNEIERF